MKKVYEGSGCDVAGRFGTIVSKDCSKILGENEVLSEENASMRAILEDMNVAVPAPKKLLSSPAAAGTPSSTNKKKRKDESKELEEAKSVEEMMDTEDVRNEPLAKKQKLNKLKTIPSIFLGGIHTNTDEETLRRHFGKYGEIIAVEIMRNAAGTPRGFGFVEFSSDDVVEAALQNEPHVINGNTVSIENSSDIVGFFSSKGKKKDGEDDEDDSSSDAFDSSLGHPKRLAYKDDSGGK